MIFSQFTDNFQSKPLKIAEGAMYRVLYTAQEDARRVANPAFALNNTSAISGLSVPMGCLKFQMIKSY